VNRAFGLFAIIVAIWIVIDFTLYQSRLAPIQTFLNRFDLAIISFLILSLAYFVSIFPSPLFRLPRWLVITSLAVTSLLSLTILFTDQFVVNAFMQDYGSNFNQGPLFMVFAGYGTLLMLFSLVVLIIKIRKFSGVQKQQIKYVLYGLGTLLVFNSVFNLFVPMLTKNFAYGRFGTYSAIFFVFFLAYSILKTHMFDLRIILTETAIIIINVISAVQIFSASSTIDVLLRMLFFVIILYGSIILLQSVRKEIEQRKEIEKLVDELKVANEHLKELDKEKDDFLSMASHELNSPLAAIRGYLSMILDDHMGGKLSEVHQKYLGNISVSTNRLIHLVKDLLNVSRIEQHRIHLIYSQVSLNDLIEQAIAEIKPNVTEKKHHLSMEIAKNIPLTWCDSDRITEVIINLLSNSVKYTDEGGKLQVSSKRVGDAVEVVVKDNGFGISKESQKKIFEKFEQGSISRDEKKGTGLGLFIVKNLIELHKGKIWVESEEGKGSEFHFTVPILDKKPHDAHEGEGEVLKLS
jgi:signal transduction histidine kinase